MPYSAQKRAMDEPGPVTGGTCGPVRDRTYREMSDETTRHPASDGGGWSIPLTPIDVRTGGGAGARNTLFQRHTLTEVPIFQSHRCDTPRLFCGARVDAKCRITRETPRGNGEE